jgi:hypothetical protein
MGIDGLLNPAERYGLKTKRDGELSSKDPEESD